MAETAKMAGKHGGQHGQLRIIGGEWRGRKLLFPAADGLRPTPDRVRETLFNWLAAHVRDARCLDLFAGSGALGLEALSRGAAHCDFVEQGQHSADTIERHLHTLACDRGKVWRADARQWLKAERGGRRAASTTSCFLTPLSTRAWSPPPASSLRDGNCSPRRRTSMWRPASGNPHPKCPASGRWPAKSKRGKSATSYFLNAP